MSMTAKVSIDVEIMWIWQASDVRMMKDCGGISNVKSNRENKLANGAWSFSRFELGHVICRYPQLCPEGVDRKVVWSLRLQTGFLTREIREKVIHYGEASEDPSSRWNDDSRKKTKDGKRNFSRGPKSLSHANHKIKWLETASSVRGLRLGCYCPSSLLMSIRDTTVESCLSPNIDSSVKSSFNIPKAEYRAVGSIP